MHASSGHKNGLSRRDFLRTGAAATAAMLLGRNLSWGASPAALSTPAVAPSFGKAKSIIQIWMWGGPSHLDTFDPKPNASTDYIGQFTKVIDTQVDDLKINPHLADLAKIADKFSVLRGMTHGLNAHETAAYLVQTGRMPGRDVYPCVGAVTSYFKGYRAGYKSLIPPYIALTNPLGRFSESGFLGINYKPFATGGDPGKDPFVVEGIVAEGITDARQRDRRKMLERLNTFSNRIRNNPAIAQADLAKQQAYDLILGDAGKVFDLAQEPPKMRERYGKNTFGQACLCARRLVEAGVPYVTINYRGWDDHKQIFSEYNRKVPQMDKALAALLTDLEQRGLLDSTIVWWGGEFGRTPKISYEAPYNGGRGHYGSAFSSFVAGGGFKGGHVIGKTDARGEEVLERPIYPCDLIGSLYHLMGIAPEATLRHPQGHELPVLATVDEQKAFVTERKERFVKKGIGDPGGGDLPLGMLNEII